MRPSSHVQPRAGKEGLLFEGGAIAFDCEEDMLAALSQDTEQFRGKVVVIRWACTHAWHAHRRVPAPTYAHAGKRMCMRSHFSQVHVGMHPCPCKACIRPWPG